MRNPSRLTVVLIALCIVSFKNASLMVTSSVFTNNGNIPMKYTCEGTQVSPPLTIGNIPSNAKSLAVIVHDPDAALPGGFTHWVMWNVDVSSSIAEGFTGGVQGLNGAKQPGYKGMCPPTGVHHYHFMVYALDTKLTIDAATDKAGLEKAMQGHILAQADLVGLYKKMK